MLLDKIYDVLIWLYAIYWFIMITISAFNGESVHLESFLGVLAIYFTYKVGIAQWNGSNKC